MKHYGVDIIKEYHPGEAYEVETTSMKDYQRSYRTMYEKDEYTLITELDDEVIIETNIELIQLRKLYGKRYIKVGTKIKEKI